ncbi:hypothetical protein Q8A67_022726 [Cirrhinus molitorella]|uniref:Uncharacterized protein n=1 Tax=Cirrhinus molitorella TaxID=172907 RepID=A0AA88P8M2_9TELE|nr:hypothetical protein Q8A67_022726 [Cirrhinus molitorella]
MSCAPSWISSDVFTPSAAHLGVRAMRSRRERERESERVGGGEVQCAARKMKWSMSIWGGEDTGGWVTAVSGTRPREKDKNSEKEREKLMA